MNPGLYQRCDGKQVCLSYIILMYYCCSRRYLCAKYVITAVQQYIKYWERVPLPAVVVFIRHLQMKLHIAHGNQIARLFSSRMF